MGDVSDRDTGKTNTSSRTKRVVQLVLLVGTAVSLWFVPWVLVWAWLRPLPATLQEQADQAVDLGFSGVVVRVDQRSGPPAITTAGWHDRERGIPARGDAYFKIASISKLYIAAATAKLVAAGKLSLDRTLAAYLPELSGRIENADQITLRMLVQHRSGIPNFTDQEGFNWFEQHRDNDAKLELGLDKPADFAPDSRYSYSNTNYLLIGRILDNELGYSHHEYIEKELLAPLGLTHTYSLLDQVNLDSVASGYHDEVEPDLKELNFVSPGGSMVATAQDVGVFLRALNDGSLLGEEAQSVYTSIYEFGHKGWLPGYESIARYHADIDAVVVQFVNTTGGELELVANVTYQRIVRILRRQNG